MNASARVVLWCVPLLLVSVLWSASSVGAKAAAKPAESDSRASAAAFEALLPVMRHPRCMNCHMRGDYPRQGDDSHPHIMDVRRGVDGHGVNAVKCSTCHQDHNLVGVHMPPGAPDWGLPPAAMPMIWQDLSAHQLCQLLKDPQRNGHKTIAQIVEHMHTPLVLWGWNPGEGRTAIPFSQGRFLHNVDLWADQGAACPAAR